MRKSSWLLVMVFRLQFSVRDKPQTLKHSMPNVKAVTCWFSYSYDRFTLWQMQNHMWFFVSGWNIEEKNSFENLRWIDVDVKNVIFLFCVMIKNGYVVFIKNVWICQPQCIYSEAKISSVYIKWFLSYDTKRTCPVSFCNSIWIHSLYNLILKVQ